MLRPTSIRYLSISGAIQTVSQLTVIDVDGDGSLDIVGAGLYSPYVNKAVPTFALINDGAGSFLSDDTKIGGATVNAREFVVADFNGDGIDDIFIADHGYDAHPFPGYKNGLLLGKEGGGFVNATSGLPKKPDFTHSVAAADIDGDGDVDLFVGNINGGKSGPYFLLNDGAARFTQSSNKLPASVVDRSKTYTTSLFIDIDGDGDMDLLLGGDGAASALLLNNGKGKFSPAKTKVPDGGFGNKNNITVDAQPFDFGQDGRMDILLVATKAKLFYRKASFQVLEAVKKGKVIDATKIHFDSQPAIKGWVKQVHFVDINHDGFLDIVGEVAGGEQALVAYLNDGNNRFYQLRPDALMAYGGLSLAAIDMDNDGRKELVQVGSSNGTYNVQIVSFVTSTGDIVGTAESDTVFGDGSSQMIDGREGDDFLVGAAGADHLIGGRGTDLLTGGSGADRFVFSSIQDSAADAPDIIMDFNRAEGDKIDLSAIDANMRAVGNQAFKFIGRNEFQSKSGELRFETTPDGINVFGDVNGDGVADFVIWLEGSISLRATDFVL